MGCGMTGMLGNNSSSSSFFVRPTPTPRSVATIVLTLASMAAWPTANAFKAIARLAARFGSSASLATFNIMLWILSRDIADSPKSVSSPGRAPHRTPITLSNSHDSCDQF